MEKNMGTADQVIRIVIAITIAVLYFNQIISGALALVLMILVGMLIITSLFSFCPLYLPFGINTKKKLEY